jgi:WD40 repeat protein
VIFFAREEETRRLASLVSVYRGVLLYGDSGSGKSSLVDAGLIPEAIRLGLAPERLRVQPRASEELVVERVGSADDDEAELLPSVLALDEEASARTVLAMDAFEERVRAACRRHRPLLIFDQFEEIVTLFDGAGARDAQRRLVERFVRLLRGSLPVKVLFSFREDYLGKVKELLSACPELVDQALRITPPTADTLPTIIRGPFERYPHHFARQLSPALADRLVTVLAERFGAGEISLSEVQTVCLRLWQSDNPEVLLAEKGPQGLLEDYLGEALDGMAAQLKPAAIALLGQMVTSAGTRNVISAGDLFQRVQEEEGDITPSLLDQALEGLSQSRLVRRERRRDLDLYEITSEFLVPWISRRRHEFRQLQDRRRERRRLLLLGSIAAALLLVVAVVTVLALLAVHSSDVARSQARVAVSAQVAGESESLDGLEPLVASLLAEAAWRIAPTAQARVSLLDAFAQPDHGVLLAGRGPVRAVVFSPDGKLLAATGTDGRARLWDVTTRRQVGGALVGSWGEVTSVAFSPDGKLLATAGTDGRARLWDITTRRQVCDFAASRVGPVTAVAFSPDGKLLATAGTDSRARLWDVTTRRQVGVLRASHTGPLTTVAFNPDSKTVATAGADGTARLWDITSHQEIAGPPLSVSSAAVLSSAFSPDGETLATASADGTVRLWDVTIYRQIGGVLSTGTSRVTSVAFALGGKTLATAGADGTARLWDVATHHQVGVLRASQTGPLTAVALAPGGKTLATAGADGTARLWDVATHHQVGTPLSINLPIESVAFSPDGRALATGGADGTARLWNNKAVNNSAAVRQIGAPFAASGNVVSVAFSPDGRTIATATADGVVRLWDVATHYQIGAPLTAGPGDATDVAFSPDAKILATAGRDGARLWNVFLPHDLVSQVCSIADHSISPTEWETYVKAEPFHPVCQSG